MERGTPPSSAGHEGYAFGQFVLDLDRGVLLGLRGEVNLRPKSFQVLQHLVEHHGRLVTTQALLEAVWGRTVVTQDSLTQCIVEIRRVLGDDGRRLVRTIPRRGYMFDAPVNRLDQAAGVAPMATAPSATPAGDETAPAPEAPRRGRLMLALVAAVLVAGLAWLLQREAPVGEGTQVAVPVLPRSIAVLPFVDMSPGQDQEYFGDGIAEEILNLLAQAPALKVIARTSSFSFKHQPVDIAEIAARLGVAFVLEGSVRMSGNRVRVTAQLIGTHDSAHVWSQSYDRELGDLIDVQSEIAAAVAAVLEQELLAARAPARGRPRDPGVYDHFLRARFLFNRRDPGDLDSAREQFEAALRLDPEYAPAWAGLAGVHIVQIGEGETTGDEVWQRAREAAERAVALDPELPEAHLRVAQVYFRAGEYDKVSEHIRLAQSLDPDNVLLLGLSAGAALSRGEVDEALSISDRIVVLDPLSRVSRFNRANIMMGAGRFEDARSEFMAVRELGPARVGEVDVYLAQLLVLDARYDEALAQLDSADPGIEYDLCLALAYHGLGQIDESAAAAARIEADGSGEAAMAMAALRAHQGETEVAFAWLAESRARFEREGPRRLLFWPQLTHVSPFLRPLRDDPRWAALHAGTGWYLR